MDIYIVRNITQFVIIFVTETACRRNGRMNVLGSVNQTFVQRFQILYANTLHVSIYQDCSRVVTHHTSTVTRASPFREETTFLISIDQTFLHLQVFRRIHEVQQWEQATECIPETGIGVHVTRQYFAIVRAVVNRLTFCIHFPEHAWEQQRTVQARIEHTVLVECTTLYISLTQYFVPLSLTLFYYSIKCIVTQFLQVQFSLFRADERRSYTSMNLFTLLSLETDNGTCVEVSLFQLAFLQSNRNSCILLGWLNIIRESSLVSEWLVEHHYEVVLEVFRNTTAVTGSITDNLVFFRNHLDGRTAVVCIYHYIRISIRESETEHGSTFCRSHFCYHIVFSQIYLIIMWQCYFTLVREPASTLLFVHFHFASYRHQ